MKGQRLFNKRKILIKFFYYYFTTLWVSVFFMWFCKYFIIT